MAETPQFQYLKDQLARNADACTPPELDDGDLDALLNATAAAQVWQAETDYAAGSVVISSPLAGLTWRAIQGGTSGETPPDWPTLGTWGYGWRGNPMLGYGGCGCGGLGQLVYDGGVIWAAGEPVEMLYDLAQATADAWLLKAARSVTLIQSSSAGQATQLQQVFDHCIKMSASWQPMRVG